MLNLWKANGEGGGFEPRLGELGDLSFVCSFAFARMDNFAPSVNTLCSDLHCCVVRSYDVVELHVHTYPRCPTYHYVHCIT